jgi:thiol:disulfide interchange protein DsbD
MGGRRNQNVIRTLSFVCALLLSLPAFAQLKLGGSTDDLLPPEKAFRFSARSIDANAVEVSFEIADGYYLYRHRLRFAA